MASIGITRLPALMRPASSSLPVLPSNGVAPSVSRATVRTTIWQEASAMEELAGSLAATTASFNAGQVAAVGIAQRLDSLTKSVVAYRDTGDAATRTAIAKSIAGDQAAILTALADPKVSALLKGGSTVSYAEALNFDGKTINADFATTDVSKLVAGTQIGADKGLFSSLTSFTAADLDGAAKQASGSVSKAATVLSALSAASVSVWDYSARLSSTGEKVFKAAAATADGARKAASLAKSAASSALYRAELGAEAASLASLTARKQLGSQSLSIANANPQSLLMLFG